MSSPRYVIEKRLIDIISDFPIDTEFTSLSLRDLYIDIHGPQSAPTARQIGRMLSLSDIVSSKPESLWIRKQGERNG